MLAAVTHPHLVRVFMWSDGLYFLCSLPSFYKLLHISFFIRSTSIVVAPVFESAINKEFMNEFFLSFRSHERVSPLKHYCFLWYSLSKFSLFFHFNLTTFYRIFTFPQSRSTSTHPIKIWVICFSLLFFRNFVLLRWVFSLLLLFYRCVTSQIGINQVKSRRESKYANKSGCERGQKKSGAHFAILKKETTNN